MLRGKSYTVNLPCHRNTQTGCRRKGNISEHLDASVDPNDVGMVRDPDHDAAQREEEQERTGGQ